MPVYKYMRKPIYVEAIQFTGENFDEIEAFVGNSIERATIIDGKQEIPRYTVQDGRQIPIYYVHTLEGRMMCLPGSYIVKGPRGEVWPVKKEIFEETYERIEEGSDAQEGKD